MNPFFSVVICSYNRAALLPRALDSLLAQSESDWEAIIVDDGSTDNTHSVIQRYTGADARIVSFQQGANTGVSAARNLGMQKAAGSFITFLDSDDEYAPQHLEVRRSFLHEHPNVQFLHSGVKVIGDPFVVDRFDPTSKIHIDNCVIGGTFFIRKDVIGLVGGFELVDYADDSVFFEKCQNANIVMTKVDYDTYIYYRNVPDQMTSAYGKQ